MKALLLIIPGLISIQFTLAQNTPWSTADNIGIGTTTPVDKLQVHDGNIRLSGTSNDGIKLSSTSGFSFNYFHIGAATGGNGVILSMNPSAGATGNPYVLGCGTADGSALFLAGVRNARKHVIITHNEFTTGPAWDLAFRTPPNGQAWLSESYDALTIKAGAPTNTVFINAAGNVGFGTASPSATLDVNGSFKANSFTLPVGAAVGRVLTSDANGLAHWENVSGVSGWSFNGTTVGAIKSIGTVDNYDFPIITNNTERMRILAGGSVAIGTTSLPAQDAKLAVKGYIYSTKVKVTQSNWSDYVFDADYRLRPLSEVEQYIQQHHHLPEVPSAKEVAKNGLDLGDNQATLLKKIEELTLYLIDMNKNQQELKAQVKQLQEENLRLQTKLSQSNP